MHDLTNKKYMIGHQKILVYGMVMMLAATLLEIVFFRGQNFFILFHSDKNDTFMDFFNSICDVAVGDPYVKRGVIYPALTYVFYGFCFRYMNHAYVADSLAWRSDEQGLVVINVITVVSVLILIRLFRSERNEQKKEYVFPTLLVLGTLPFWYAFERGNLILQAILMLMVFIRFYNSENKVLRELALIGLAISASMKIYPAIFGLILLKDKKYKETLRCLLYGILVFVIPFFMYDGFNSIIMMLKNIASTGDKFTQTWIGYGYKVNISNTVNFLSEWLGIQLPAKFFAGTLLALSLMTFILAKERWQIFTAFSCLAIMFPQFSYTYTLTFMAIPLWDFYNHAERNNKFNWYVAVLFLLIMCPFPFGGINPLRLNPDVKYQVNMTTAISSVGLILLVISVAIESAIQFIMAHKSRRHGIFEKAE